MDALEMAIYAYDQLPGHARNRVRLTKELEFDFVISPFGPIIEVSNKDDDWASFGDEF
jgi:hypothetical protein